MNRELCEHVVKFQQLQAEALAELEAIIGLNATLNGANSLVKIQTDLVHLNERFTRLVYLSGMIESEKEG